MLGWEFQIWRSGECFCHWDPSPSHPWPVPSLARSPPNSPLLQASIIQWRTPSGAENAGHAGGSQHDLPFIFCQKRLCGKEGCKGCFFLSVWHFGGLAVTPTAATDPLWSSLLPPLILNQQLSISEMYFEWNLITIVWVNSSFMWEEMETGPEVGPLALSGLEGRPFSSSVFVYGNSSHAFPI